MKMLVLALVILGTSVQPAEASVFGYCKNALLAGTSHIYKLTSSPSSRFANLKRDAILTALFRDFPFMEFHKELLLTFNIFIKLKDSYIINLTAPNGSEIEFWIQKLPTHGDTLSIVFRKSRDAKDVQGVSVAFERALNQARIPHDMNEILRQGPNESIHMALVINRIPSDQVEHFITLLKSSLF